MKSYLLTFQAQTEVYRREEFGMKINKAWIAVICAAVALLTIIYAAVRMKEAHEERLAAEAMALEEQRIAEDVVLPIAQALGIDDLVFEYIEPSALDATCYFSSESYDSLSDEEKLALLVAVAEKTRLNDNYFPSGSEHYGNYFDFRIISGEHTYRDFTTNGDSWLMQDDERVFSMETSYARSFERKRGSSVGSGNCTWCNGTGRMKYYYGASALEAFIDGQPNSYYAQCGSCQGTGKER